MVALMLLLCLVGPLASSAEATGTGTSPVSFSAVKDNQSLSSQVAVVLTDVQGNHASCI